MSRKVIVLVGFHPSKKWSPLEEDGPKHPLLYECLDAIEKQTRRDLIDQIHVVQNNISGVKGMIKSRNEMREWCLSLDMDMWIVDSDTIVPSDAIEKLTSVPEDFAVVGGLYKTNRVDYSVFSRLNSDFIEIARGHKSFPLKLIHPVDEDWHEVGAVGAGCCLYRTPFLSQIEFNTEWKGQIYGKADDMCVCLNALEQGLRISAHFGVRCIHKR